MREWARWADGWRIQKDGKDAINDAITQPTHVYCPIGTQYMETVEDTEVWEWWGNGLAEPMAGNLKLKRMGKMQ